jgi:hypothetical protein|tara:strand:+ start:17 stop:385 length:369 start_codon:yes stop_codon:yes gene_type:complete
MRFRSGLEKRTADFLNKRKVKFQYEEVKLKWQDLRMRTYTPDFVLSNGIIIETKGRFISSDRTKHLFVKAQHSELDIRFVFSNPRAKLYKGAKSSYGDWCDKHGFQYARETIPIEWLKEKKK